jgi:hypothetical protein
MQGLILCKKPYLISSENQMSAMPKIADVAIYCGLVRFERKTDSQRSRVELQSLFQLQTFVNQRH